MATMMEPQLDDNEGLCVQCAGGAMPGLRICLNCAGEELMDPAWLAEQEREWAAMEDGRHTLGGY